MSDGALHMDRAVSKDDTTPLLIVIPGLTSDSSSAVSYIMHFSVREMHLHLLPLAPTLSTATPYTNTHAQNEDL